MANWSIFVPRNARRSFLRRTGLPARRQKKSEVRSRKSEWRRDGCAPGYSDFCLLSSFSVLPVAAGLRDDDLRQDRFHFAFVRREVVLFGKAAIDNYRHSRRR